MDSVLKLNLKKEIFEKVTSGQISDLKFETTPFYFSRFTTSKNNTVEDVENDPTLFKKFDKVQFACSGETIECDVKRLTFTTSLEENHEISFYLVFDSHIKSHENLESETYTETYEDYKENVVETEVVYDDTKTEDVINETPVEISEIDEPKTEFEVEVEDTTLLDNSDIVYEEIDEEIDENSELIEVTISEFINKHNVYCVNNSTVKIGYKGKVWGSADNKSLPIKNEHDHCVKLEKLVIDNYKNLLNEIDKLTKSGYLFVDVEHSKIDKGIIELYVKNVSKLETLNWI